MENIQHHQEPNRGWFYYEKDGIKLAEMIYRINEKGQMVIEHTEVDDSLRGQGVGRKLLETLIHYVREKRLKVVVECSYAKATLDRSPDWQDILAA